PNEAACVALTIGITSGPDSGRIIDLPVRGPLAQSGIKVDDRIEMSRYPDLDTNLNERVELSQRYAVSGIVRHLPLLALTLVFAAVVVWIGRVRGALALAALGVSAWVLLRFVLPALIT